jgi:hypothetical protein
MNIIGKIDLKHYVQSCIVNNLCKGKNVLAKTVNRYLILRRFSKRKVRISKL